jgi:hypothetical protein
LKICPFCRFDRVDDTATQCRQCGGDLAAHEAARAVEEGPPSAAWFHYLEVPGVGTVELVPGQVLRIGRGRGNELVVPKLTSELAAELFWTDDYDEVTIKVPGKDLVRVDGLFVKGNIRTLKGGEELQVGPARLDYKKSARQIPGAIDAGKIKGARRSPGQAVSVGSPATSGALDPSLKRLPKAAPGPPSAASGTPAQVCQALEQTRGEGTLLVRSPRGNGWVSIERGAPRFASFAGHKGQAALEAILRLPAGTCRMLSGAPRKGSSPPIRARFSDLIRAGVVPSSRGRPARGRPRPAGGRPGRPGARRGRPGARGRPPRGRGRPGR